MRILLINPPSLPGTTANREGTAGMGVTVCYPRAFFYPPQTIAYSVAFLREAGHTVWAVDAVGDAMDIPHTLSRITASPPDIMVIQVAPHTWEADRTFLQALAQALPHTPRLLIGTGAQFIPREQWTDLADAVLTGDAEWGICQAVEALVDRKDAPGLWWPDRPTPPPPVRIPPQARLPRPAWDALPVERYPFLTLWGSRGCNAHCRWCPYVLGWGNTQRARRPEEVAAELVWLARTYRKPRHMFRDPVFAADPSWVEAFCHAIGECSPSPPPWECEDRPEHLTPERVALMARAGCTQIKLGLEVLSGPLLHRWERLAAPTDLQTYQIQAANVIRACRQHNVLCRVFIVIGLGETEEDLEATARFLAHVRPHYISVKRFTLYPGLNPPPHRSLPEATLASWETRLAQLAAPPRPPRWGRARHWIRRFRRGFQWGNK